MKKVMKLLAFIFEQPSYLIYDLTKVKPRSANLSNRLISILTIVSWEESNRIKSYVLPLDRFWKQSGNDVLIQTNDNKLI